MRIRNISKEGVKFASKATVLAHLRCVIFSCKIIFMYRAELAFGDLRVSGNWKLERLIW